MGRAQSVFVRIHDEPEIEIQLPSGVESRIVIEQRMEKGKWRLSYDMDQRDEDGYHPVQSGSADEGFINQITIRR